DEVMPPEGQRLTADQVKMLRDWIDSGAAWPDALAGEGGKARHWAFIPPQRPPVPLTRNPQSAIRNPIDSFVLAKLRSAGLAPAPEADRVTLIRRLSLDLLGLPPTVEQVDEFVNDTHP